MFSDMEVQVEKICYSVDEAAELLGVCRATLYNRIRAGDGPMRQYIGRRLVFSRESLEQYVRSLPSSAPKAA